MIDTGNVNFPQSVDWPGENQNFREL